MKGKYNVFSGLTIFTLGLAALAIWAGMTLPNDNLLRIPIVALSCLTSIFFLATAAGNLTGVLRGSRIDPVWQNRFFAGAIAFGMSSAIFFIFSVLNGFQMRIHGEMPWQLLTTIVSMAIGVMMMAGMVFVRGTDIKKPHFPRLMQIWSPDYKTDEWKQDPPN